MAHDVVKAELHELAGLVGSVVRDAERLVGQHVNLLRSEFHQAAREAPATLVAIGAGTALVAAGGVLGSLMVVHGLHKSNAHPALGMLWSGRRNAGGRRGQSGHDRDTTRGDDIVRTPRDDGGSARTSNGSRTRSAPRPAR